MWMEASFYVVMFTGNQFHFLEDFFFDYQSLQNKSYLELSKLAETPLLNGVMTKRVQQEKHVQFVYNLKSKLFINQGIITQF